MTFPSIKNLLLVSLVILSLINSSLTETSKSITPSLPLSREDKQRLGTIFESSLSSKNPEANTWHYSALGYYLLQQGDFPKSEAACQLFVQTITQVNPALELTKANIENLYHSFEGASLTSKDGCTKFSAWPNKAILDAVVKNLQKFLLSDEASESAETLFYAISSLKKLKAPVDSKLVSSVIDKILKKDTSANVQLYVFQIVVLSDYTKPQLKRHFDDIEDVVQQADEADGKYVYFESGLYTTAYMVDAIYKLAGKYGEVPKIPEEKLLKLSNFLLSRRFTYQPRAAAYLTLALRTLAENGRIVPVSLSIADKDASGKLLVSLTDVWGRPLDSKLKADSIKLVNSNNVLNKAPIDLKKEGNLYSLDLSPLSLARGYYNVKITGPTQSPQGAILVGIAGDNVLPFKISSKSTIIGPILLSVEESDGSSSDAPSSSLHQQVTLANPSESLKTDIGLDTHVKLRVSLTISDIQEGAVFRPHQCFFRLRHVDSGRELFLIPDGNSKTESGPGKLVLQVVVDPLSQAKDFDYLSGKYSIEFIVNDALIDNGARWQLGNINLQLPSAPVPPPSSPSPLVHWADAPRLPGQKPKAEIHHMFRTPDQRAPKILAYAFTALCGLPIVILLVLWMKLGVNVNGIGETAISAIGFHVCLAGIFFLYYLYWTAWNMFTTLGFIFLLGIPTFLFGNKMLRGIASHRLLQGKKAGHE